MRLNCDLGEGFDVTDEKIMPSLHMANIACGAHAGNPDTMRRTVELACQNNVSIGAHPGYPDKVNFGRKSLVLSDSELENTLHSQIESLKRICSGASCVVDYVKPHGALYNDMMRNDSVLKIILGVVSQQFTQPKLVIQATGQASSHQTMALDFGVELLFEAFADRAYTDDFALVPRSESGAVLTDSDSIISQVKTLWEKGVIISQSGRALMVKADTLCIHGDNMASVATVSAIQGVLEGNG